jgi:hypothetical protein
MRSSAGGGAPIVKSVMLNEYGLGGGRDRISPGSSSFDAGMADMTVQKRIR